MSQRALISTTVVFFFSVFLFLLMVLSDRSLPSFLWVSFKVLYIIGLHYIVLWFLFTRFLGASRAGTVLVNLSIAMTATVLVLIAAEFVLRFAFHDVSSTGDNLSYFSTKWQQTVHYNRWGFRERDFDPKKPSGTYRIAVIGDSLTYGQGIREQERFSNLLEERLNSHSGRKYQVLNFGLPGAETTDELGFLTRSVLSNKPDFILLQWYINDVEGDDKSEQPRQLTIIPPDLRHNSILFYLAHREFSSIQSRLGWVQSYEHYMSDRFGNPNSPASLKATATMNTFIDICRKFNIPLGVVLFSESYFDPASKLDFLLERTLGICKEQGLRCVDTRSVLLPLQGDRRLWASRFDPHPSALANHLVADRLLETYGDIWLR
jgi:lysophospholipase L1-like esterase